MRYQSLTIRSKRYRGTFGAEDLGSRLASASTQRACLYVSPADLAHSHMFSHFHRSGGHCGAEVAPTLLSLRVRGVICEVSDLMALSSSHIISTLCAGSMSSPMSTVQPLSATSKLAVLQLHGYKQAGTLRYSELPLGGMSGMAAVERNMELLAEKLEDASA